jgi:hypothetical protein
MARLAVVPVLALFNLFGQRPKTASAGAPAATLSLYAPTRLRGGLLWEARIRSPLDQLCAEGMFSRRQGWVNSAPR